MRATTILAIITTAVVLVKEANELAKTSEASFSVPCPQPVQQGRSLFAMAVGNSSFAQVYTIFKKWGFDKFDYLLFVYDEDGSYRSYFTSPLWPYRAYITVIDNDRYHHKWYYFKKYITPQLMARYQYLWYWDDDVGLDQFDVDGFYSLLTKYDLQLAQPAIWGRTPHPVCKVHNESSNPTLIGRWTDFVEVMVPVIHQSVWECIWSLQEDNFTTGYGYDTMWSMYCNITRIAIVDLWPVTHIDRKVTEKFPSRDRMHPLTEKKIVEKKYAEKYLAQRRSFGYIGEGCVDLMSIKHFEQHRRRRVVGVGVFVVVLWGTIVAIMVLGFKVRITHWLWCQL